METIYLGLGSNQGDSIQILRSAVTALAKIVTRVRVSSIWHSKAKYVEDQTRFFNLVVEACTKLSPDELLTSTMGVEAQFGRDRSREIPKGPRSLDIDLLLYGSRMCETARLSLPHPGMAERKFVLLPLLELDAQIVHPVTGQSFFSLLQDLPPQGIYLFHGSSYDLHYI